MNNQTGKYDHLKSFKDIQHEKKQLDFKARLLKKELEIHFIRLGHDLHPVRLVPTLLTEWATPLMIEVKNRFLDLILGLLSMKEYKKE